MPLSEELRSQGNWLFRHRSHVPLAMLVLLAPVAFEIYAGRYGFRTRWEWQVGCAALAALGLIIRVLAVGFAAPGTSGRNTKGQKAADLNASGLYATVRHPLYVGNFLITLALLLFTGAWWLALSGTLIYWLYYERIIYAEEAFLRQTYGERFVTWASETPAIVPRFWRWRAPERTFSVRRVVRGEYATLFGAVTAFALLDTFLCSVLAWAPAYQLVWAVAFVVALVVYLAVRSFLKFTRALDGQ